MSPRDGPGMVGIPASWLDTNDGWYEAHSLSAPDPRAFLSDLAPFHRLRDGEMARLATTASPAAYAPGQTVLERFAIPEYLFVVIEGVVEELDSLGPVGRYAPGETFDSRALIEGRSQHRFVAKGQCVCYLLPVPLLLTFIRTNRPFRDFFHDDMARRLEAFVQVQQQREAASLLTARIAEHGFASPVFADAATSIQDAVALMKLHGRSAILVRDAERTGIFTGRDVRERSVLMGLPDSTPIGGLASYDLITLARDDLLFNAFVTMTKHAIRHVVVTDGERIVGVLEQADLLSQMSNTSHYIAHQVDRAESLDDLKEAADRLPRFVRSLYERGVKPRYIAPLVTDLNRKIMAHLFERDAPAPLLANACLMVMGSEGRGEQLIRTDQDNGMIFRGSAPPAGFERITEAFPAALAELGYPPCPGDVMVSNPAWAKSLDAYGEDVRRWVHRPSAQGFMDMAIFLDASVVAGDAALLDELKSYLFQLIRGQENVVRHFARAIQAFDTPITTFNRFQLEKAPPRAGTLDIKKGGIFPIVHGVRSLALEHCLSETNTVARIQLLAGKPPFEEGFTADLIEALEFMSMIRLRAQLAARDGDEASPGGGNDISPDALTKLERGLLRDSLKLVKQFKKMLEHHFRLNMV